MTTITGDDGRVFGRAAIWPVPDDTIEGVPQGVSVIGGFYGSTLSGIMGVLIARSHTAARDIGIPLIPSTVLRRWANEESQRRLNEQHAPEVLEKIANVLRKLEANVMKYPFVRTKDGWITGEEVMEKAKSLQTVYIVQDASYDIAVRNEGAFELNDDVFVVDVGQTSVLSGRATHSNLFVDWPVENEAEGWGEHKFYARSLAGAVIEALAKVWNCSLESVVQASSFSSDEESFTAEIGKRGESVVTNDHLKIVRRPTFKNGY